ncbi:uncharacterized protein OCT59_009835 [Rhizophagus irregularis]|uniref:Actin-like ATPase domain-containing protein n=2 Tax=Rhizophagus irregularis TaxID=588596 RepID=A0A015JNI9_RHIIW|nr:hypothetical protein GLOIN_2v1678595 [Rhizophagus irregularis DAOM 181602=DAOM 197198]EXX56524.1 hypothetical protein RirG_215440 [Rhizophagus irregularis DAOM 197198w]UZO18522.1 hypothetical protein OCT59_009835 [Rhizophagus irregularis]POG64104.1 hypothetical protein GLOIN_2v1678595 [Rhizophagus irregularis DAOM 181602=DAOM 197198]CAG8440520.1 18336_t:CDS:2 [Rhizophagus irregularis]GBC29224.1 hypothetical protein GLOIN_2v1678595 [Rhizophagus irregularis DAOM 181602=DAOM 197198]|eukprot:XP_025170970.1 hypothetical protein GLOIN_2v1678595 [Rhizophagus irregularis DAOM 181602=DAOM 197198]
MASSKQDIEVVVAIDFGTVSSGYAYANKSNPGEITVENRWDGFIGYKTPTIIKYDESYSSIISWGFSALPERPRRRGNDNQTKPIELFKLFLFKEKSFLPDNLDYKRVISDYLRKLGEMIKGKVNNIWSSLNFYSQVLIVLTVPVEFDDNAIAIMRDCAFNANLIKERDSRYLLFITEPAAAAIHCLNSSEKNKLKPEDSFIVVDCGGGAVNLTSHKLLEDNKISELTESTSGNCGSSLIDKKFVEFLGRKLGSSTIESLEKNHYNILQYIVQEFCKEVKIPFTGQKSEFQRYEIVLENYPSIIEEARKQGFLKESDSVWVEFSDVRGMFDPLINKIIDLIKGQLAQQPNKKSSVIMLVGGFSESKYLQDRIIKEFNKTVSDISVPLQPMIAAVKGGVQYGLRTDMRVHTVLRRTYGTDAIRKSLPGDPPSQILPNGYTIIFDPLAERGKPILVNEKVVREFKPHSMMQRSISFDLYVTKALNAKFCNDPGVSLLRPWEIELPENDNYEDVTILFTLTFGAVEILATAENQKTGEKYQVKVKYD